MKKQNTFKKLLPNRKWVALELEDNESTHTCFGSIFWEDDKVLLWYAYNPNYPTSHCLELFPRYGIKSIYPLSKKEKHKYIPEIILQAAVKCIAELEHRK